MNSDIVKHPKFAVIDSDFRRRAALSQDLLKIGGHVEPFENANEFADFCRDDRVLMICDEGQAIELAIGVQSHMGTSSPVIAYAPQVDACKISDAFHLGISDYLPWPIEVERLQSRVYSVLQSSHELFERKRKSAEARTRMKRLSPREIEVLEALSKGGSNKQVAQELGISVRTVEVHRSRILSKLKATNAVEAAKIIYDSEID